jgi:diguanylate cyclase (GGDEF)-like protein
VDGADRTAVSPSIAPERRPAQVANFVGPRLAFATPGADSWTVSPSLEKLRGSKALMAYTAAAMYGGAAFDGSIEGFLPGDPSFALVPVFGAIGIAIVLAAIGPRLPIWALGALGPIGVVLIAYALTATTGPGDGAVLYMWPVLWTTFFFGRRGAVSIVALVGVAHATTLLLLPAASSYPGRWVDVMVSVSVVAGVVLTLVRHNDLLLERLTEEARTDALTGLLNRRGFEERAIPELAHARRDGTPIAVATVDIDYFKQVNDEWGHEIGDRVLRCLGRLLAEHTRDIDVLARFGGEEFVVLLPGCSSSSAESFARSIRSSLIANRTPDLPAVRASIGVCALVAPPNIQMLLSGADSALYQAKRAGRDRVVAFRSRGDSEAADVQPPTEAVGEARS